MKSGRLIFPSNFNKRFLPVIKYGARVAPIAVDRFECPHEKLLLSEMPDFVVNWVIIE